MRKELHEKLFSICTDGGLNEDGFNEILQVFYQHSREVQISEDEHKRKAVLLDRQLEAQKRFNREMTDRHNSKMMSVIYLIDAVAKTGTHREKETVIMYMRVILQGLLEHDPITYSDTDLLPF